MSSGTRSSMLWAATWAVGVALGVALGAWLSVIGAQGAPGIGAVDVGQELVLAPVIAGCTVFVGYLAVSSAWRFFRKQR